MELNNKLTDKINFKYSGNKNAINFISSQPCERRGLVKIHSSVRGYSSRSDSNL